MNSSSLEISVPSGSLLNGISPPTKLDMRYSSSSSSGTSTFDHETATTASTPATLNSDYAIPVVPGPSSLVTISGISTTQTTQTYVFGPSPIVTVDEDELQKECTGIMLRNGKKYKVSLSLFSLTWERERKAKRIGKKGQKKYELKLEDVLGACSHLNFNFRHLFRKGRDLFKLRVYTYKKMEDGKWKNSYFQFFCHSLVEVQEWAKSINMRINLLQRPRRVHVFVNPFSGEGLACKVYNTKIAHIFQIAGITTTVTVTERAGHAGDIVREMDLNSTDAIVCIGGDGVFHEVFNGLLWRQQYEMFGEEARKVNPQPCPIKIGLIPAGSTNTVVYCTTGLADTTTSAMQIAMGRELKIDLTSCWFDGEIERFGTNFLGYGFFGDVLKSSEEYRWMGPTRYDFSGFKTIVNLKSYKGRIEFKEGLTSGSPQDICKHGCLVCKETTEQSEGQWTVLEDHFVSIDGCVMSCCSPQANKGLSPAAHIGDGCLDLIVHRRASPLRYLKYLANTAFFSKPFTGDLVDVHRVTEFMFSSTCSHDKDTECGNCSTWNIDGELYHQHSIHVKVHRQGITLLACQPG
ncbi:ceramide kinase-like isoform X2 [Bolinopsis microptera]|uniref:ceramide kinase-like isoform X2 n=1 Tax=Bolinopsis microptera TaxID=2820187 RepID=UPI0030797599